MFHNLKKAMIMRVTMVSRSAGLAQELVVRMYSLVNIIDSTTPYSQYSDLYLASYTYMHAFSAIQH